MSRKGSYRATFRRHRFLLSLPVVLCVIVAGWVVAGSAKSYLSTTSLWIDNAAPQASSVGNVNIALLSPAQQEQSVVTELLATDDFVLGVGHDSMLGGYLVKNGSGGFGPSALLSKLTGKASEDSQIESSLGPNVTTTVAGPQVLQISFSGPAPLVAQNTLDVLVHQLLADSKEFNLTHNESTLTYYQGQESAAQQAYAAAREQAGAYLRQHRRATGTDPNLTALSVAESQANTQLVQARNAYNQAAAGLRGDSSGLTVSQIDSPTLPGGASTGKKKVVEAVVGGLFAGALISLLVTILLTPSMPRDPWEDELVQPAGSARMTSDPIPSAASETAVRAAPPSIDNVSFALMLEDLTEEGDVS